MTHATTARHEANHDEQRTGWNKKMQKARSRRGQAFLTVCFFVFL
jgi:hypothetical protein